jgi:branched-chain amino acid transport system substrate-binding protein
LTPALEVISDVRALALNATKGLIITTAYHWDRDGNSREFALRFEARMKRKPGMIHAAVYSGVLHYLKAIKLAGTTEGKAVATKIREKPVQDLVTANAQVRADGRLLLAEVKSPSESNGDWDYYKILRTVPADQAGIPLAQRARSLSNSGLGDP